MLKKLALQITIILLFFPSAVVTSKNTEDFQRRYVLRQYTDENGLPQNSIKSLAEDKNGFIWAATENGLVRFDGIHFYTFDKSNTGLTNSRFFELQPSLRGDHNCFYASSDNGTLRIQNGIAVFDSLYRKNSYYRLPYLRESPREAFVSAGLPHKVNVTNINSLHYLILCPDTEGTYYIFDKQKVEFFKKWSKSWQVKIPEKNLQNYFRLNNQLFLFSEKGYIQHISPSKVTKKPIAGDILKDPAFTQNKTEIEIYWNNVSDQVFILLGQKFYLLIQSRSGWHTKLILDGFDFKMNNITSVHYSNRDGRLFLGSITRGLFAITKRNFQTLTINENDITNVMYAQTLRKNNEIIIPQGYVISYSGSGHEKIKARLSPTLFRHNEDKRAILTDQSGNIWHKNGNLLYVHDYSGEKLLYFWKFTDEIKTLYEGKDGRIWIGMKSTGLYYLSAKNTTAKKLKLSGPKIRECSFLLQTDNHTLYVGTTAGLYEIDLKSSKNVLVAGTSDLNIRSLYVSSQYPNGVFITTNESGVFLYTQGSLVHFPLDRGRYLAAAHCIAEDNNGFFWIPTNKGLFRFSVKDMLAYNSDVRRGNKPSHDLFYSYYVKENGFLTNEFNGGCQPCMVKLSNGKISLPSLNGVVIFDPQTIEPALSGNVLILDRYDVSGKTYINQKDTIMLDKDAEHITFNVTLAQFGNENERQLSYRLSPVNSKPDIGAWIPMEAKDPTIRFTKILYGNYYLFIKSQNGFGRNNFLIKKILIKVPPHWYETIWFRILCLAAILGTIYCYTRLRTIFLKRKNHELEEKISIRTAKLEETLSALRISEKKLNRQMYIRDRLVASITHDVRSPMKYLIQSAERIEGLIAKEQYSQVTQIGKTITKSSLHIVRLLENMVLYIKAQVYNEGLILKTVNLHHLVKEKADLFQPAFKEQSNRLQVNIETDTIVCSDPHLLGIVMHNLIDNANKFTYNGLIRISTEARKNELHLIIADSGRGIPHSMIQWLNAPPSGSSSPPEECNGLGLLIVKEISAMIGVVITADNQEGTRVCLSFIPALKSNILNTPH